MEVDDRPSRGEGFRPYYITKIEELQLIVADKSQNLRRLQAQRNELNAKGIIVVELYTMMWTLHYQCNCLSCTSILNSAYVARRASASSGAGFLCGGSCETNG